MEQVWAPFTPDQVMSLNEFQASGLMHPFTCPHRREGAHLEYTSDFPEDVLHATVDGWVCTVCDYTQSWAHLFMADWTWKSVLRNVQEAFQQ